MISPYAFRFCGNEKHRPSCKTTAVLRTFLVCVRAILWQKRKTFVIFKQTATNTTFVMAVNPMAHWPRLLTHFGCICNGFRAATVGFPKAFFQYNAPLRLSVLTTVKAVRGKCVIQVFEWKTFKRTRPSKDRWRRRYEYDNKIQNITLLFTIAIVQCNRDTRHSALATRFVGNDCFSFSPPSDKTGVGHQRTYDFGRSWSAITTIKNYEPILSRNECYLRSPWCGLPSKYTQIYIFTIYLVENWLEKKIFFQTTE